MYNMNMKWFSSARLSLHFTTSCDYLSGKWSGSQSKAHIKANAPSSESSTKQDDNSLPKRKRLFYTLNNIFVILPLYCCPKWHEIYVTTHWQAIESKTMSKYVLKRRSLYVNNARFRPVVLACDICREQIERPSNCIPDWSCRISN
jgi:hypothetical protein